MPFIPKDYSAHWICLCQYHVKSTDGFRRTISAQFSGKSSIDIIKSTTNLRYVQVDVLPKIRVGLLDEATTWEEWYFQPIW
jgi:hypothetical protein